MTITAPYGSWKSPITADLIVADSISLGGTKVEDDRVYWQESRPSEGGRTVIVRKDAGGEVDVTPPGFNARNRVHEYGGAAAIIDNGIVYFSNDADQRLYRQDPGADPIPLTPEGALRFADGSLDLPRRRGIWVMEDHSREGKEAQNSLVSVSLEGGEPNRLVSGNDFYSNPRLSPDGSKFAWLTWNHPNMPWDGCELWVASVGADGNLAGNQLIAGGAGESIFQPSWSPDGNLYFIADRSGWWNLYRQSASGVEVVYDTDAEFGLPLWAFGMSTYAFAGPDALICQFARMGEWHAATLDLASGAFRPLNHDYAMLNSISVQDGVITALTVSQHEPEAIVQIDAATGKTLKTVKSSAGTSVDRAYVSTPEMIEFPTEDGLTAHGFFYAPTNADYEAPSGTLPPLIVKSHGGPTGATDGEFDFLIQYWTSRGVAVVDVNYGGSTGFGREYRERLRDNWGVVDVDDCCNAALYLAREGRVDGNRLAIRGTSAGGYTTLSTLAFRDVFHAGVSLFGICDLEAMAVDTHKFESRYLDGLIGPYPERQDLYRERSAIHSTDQLSCPVAFFQGLEDKIVPPNQASMMVEALRSKGLPFAHVEYESEQHGFRRSENILRTLEGEFYFYSRVFGFTPADDLTPIEIVNL
jgi:dipeptidyl aminopeptidase/acylaminoacyl peptidase